MADLGSYLSFQAGHRLGHMGLLYSPGMAPDRPANPEDHAGQSRRASTERAISSAEPIWLLRVAAWLNTGPASIKVTKALVSLLMLLSLATASGVAIAMMNYHQPG
jgi:hypothetical protein